MGSLACWLVHDVHGLCIMFHHLAQESGVDPWSSPTRVLYFCPPYATNCLGSSGKRLFANER